jgi:hypothetical protein
LTAHSSTPTSLASSEQRDAIEAPIEARLLVLAGAGTGKTFVLSERIHHLVGTSDVAPGRELLVLSFTRAVVRELKDRIGAVGNAARLVRPITFDSFATRLLATMPDDQLAPGWRESGYDSRIAAAARALGTDEGKAVVAEYRHVFVDEIQDLVGVRATLVDALLARAFGFTLLGDPAQAIYDHQVRQATDTTSSESFLRRVRTRHPELRTVTLHENFRTRGRYAAEIDQVGSDLRLEQPDPGAVAAELAETVRGLDQIDGLDELAGALRGCAQRVALLCRSNNRALAVSRSLSELGIDHRLQREATERVLPSWLALLFRGAERTHWGERRLVELAKEKLKDEPNAPDPESLWKLLSDAVIDDSRFDLDVFRERTRLGLLPDELYESQTSNVIVSTIHRSKGLEFDLVLLTRPERDIEDERDLEELRVLYVALSRARDEVWTLKLPDSGWWRRDASTGDRLIRSPWREPRKTLGFEVRPEDFESSRPFGRGRVAVDPAAAQDYLYAHLRRGEMIDLDLVPGREHEEQLPSYLAKHGSTPVAETTEQFGRLLARRLGTSRSWPATLHGLMVDGLETVVGSPSEGEVSGLGVSGLWLRPRLLGLTEIRWQPSEEQEAADDPST